MQKGDGGGLRRWAEGLGWGGGKRYATWRGMWKRERVSERGELGRGRGIQSAQGKHKKGGK